MTTTHDPKIRVRKSALRYENPAWYWACESAHCKAVGHDTYGYSPIWELALAAANAHHGEYHYMYIPHDPPTPPNGLRVPRDIPAQRKGQVDPR